MDNVDDVTKKVTEALIDLGIHHVDMKAKFVLCDHTGLSPREIQHGLDNGAYEAMLIAEGWTING